MDKFSFDPNLSPEQNVDRFHQSMASIDVEMAAQLKTHLAKLLPLLEGQSQRQSARVAFNRAIEQFLDRRAGKTAGP